MYNVKINEPNKFFILRGKQIRSPFSINIYDSEVKNIRSKIKSYGIINFEITYYEKNKIPHDDVNPPKIKEDVKKEVKENLNISSIHTIPMNSKPRFQREKSIPIQDYNKSNGNINLPLESETKIEELSIKTSSILENLFKKYEI